MERGDRSVLYYQLGQRVEAHQNLEEVLLPANPPFKI
jgi:hypothetical protein